MTALLQDYLSLIIPEHQGQPNYEATITATVQPFIDGQNLVESFPSLFDVDIAVGQQLDYTGQWIGRSRYLVTPLNVYFSFDTQNLGWDQGIWYSPGDS